MTIHRYHPDPLTNDPNDGQLYDNCPRCEYQATTLMGLDLSKLAWVWVTMHMTMKEVVEIPRQLTVNENRAISTAYDMALIFEKLTGVWPSPDVLISMSDRSMISASSIFIINTHL